MKDESASQPLHHHVDLPSTGPLLGGHLLAFLATGTMSTGTSLCTHFGGNLLMESTYLKREDGI